MKISRRTTLIIGGTLGFFSSIMGSYVFGVILSGNSRIQSDIMFFATIGSLITFVPGILGGILITYILNYFYFRNKFTLVISCLTGLIIGMLAGFIPSSIIASLFLLSRKVPIDRLFEIVWIVISIAGLFGSLTGSIYYFILIYSTIRVGSVRG